MNTQKVIIYKTNGTILIMTLILNAKPKDKTIEEFAEIEVKRHWYSFNPITKENESTDFYNCEWELKNEADMPIVKCRETLKGSKGTPLTVDKVKEAEIETAHKNAELIAQKKNELAEAQAIAELKREGKL